MHLIMPITKSVGQANETQTEGGRTQIDGVLKRAVLVMITEYHLSKSWGGTVCA